MSSYFAVFWQVVLMIIWSSSIFQAPRQEISRHFWHGFLTLYEYTEFFLLFFSFCKDRSWKILDFVFWFDKNFLLLIYLICFDVTYRNLKVLHGNYRILQFDDFLLNLFSLKAIFSCFSNLTENVSLDLFRFDGNFWLAFTSSSVNSVSFDNSSSRVF